MESETIDKIEQGGGALRTIKDLAAGAAGGMAQVLLGMCAQLNQVPEKRSIMQHSHEIRSLWNSFKYLSLQI
jgi:hypothetical protein